MALSCGASCVRITLLLLNTLFLVIGLSFFGFGFWLVVDNDALKVLRAALGILTTADLVWGAAVIIIIISILVFLVAAFGCCGSLKSNGCCLGIYVWSLIVLLVLQAIAMILVGVFYGQIDANLSKNLDLSLDTRYGKPEYPGSTNGWNIFQTEISCCGVKNSMDWKTSWWKNATQGKNVPDQCCVLKKKSISNPEPVDPTACQAAAYDESYPDRSLYINAKGCEQKIIDWMNGYFAIAMTFIGVVLLFQIAIVLLGCCLKNSVKKQTYEKF